MSLPPPHRLTLPDVPVNEQGMRQLEIWLEGKLGRRGGGLQYHKAKHYGAHNVGDWLDVATTAYMLPSPLDNSPGAFVGMYFHATERSIAFRSESDGHLIEYGLISGNLIGYLGGGQDIIYTQGGDFFRNTGGGDANFYLSDGVNNSGNSGNYNVYADDQAGGGDGSSPGTVNYYLGGTFGGAPGTGTFEVHGDSTTFRVKGDTTTELHLASDKTFIVYDSGDNPLVTYTG